MAKSKRPLVCPVCRAGNSGLSPACYACGAALDPGRRGKPGRVGGPMVGRRRAGTNLGDQDPGFDNSARQLEDRHDE